MSEENMVLPEYDECTIEVHAAEGGGYVATVLLADGTRYPGLAAVTQDKLSASLMELVQEPFDYGEKLNEVFLNGSAKDGLAVARTRGRDAGKGLRLRLDIPPDARWLHTLNWEWLCDSTDRVPYAASPDFAVSRFLAPTGRAAGNPVKIQPLRVLVVISNPTDLKDPQYNLPPLDPEVEHDRMAEALAKLSGQVEWTFLPGRATVENIRNQLESGAFHVLHVMAHGYFKEKGFLMLEDEGGKAQPVDEYLFGDMLLGQPQVRLVVLAACLSAARSQASAFAGLAPALVARGVPAVVAMQGRIEIGSAQAFVEHFYRRLGKCGMVDSSVNDARYHLLLDPQRRDFGDWGTPVLFMNTERGELYYPSPVDVGAYLPEGLRYQFLTLLQQFVDRQTQQDLLWAIIKGEDERILYVSGSKGMGKSWFIGLSVTQCQREGILWRSLDFKVHPDQPWDYLTVIDKMVMADKSVFDDYRALLERTTQGGQERGRAFNEEKQRELTKVFALALTRLPTDVSVVYFLDQHTDSQAPEPVQRWLWDIFLPLFQGRSLNLSRVTVVLSGPTEPAGLDEPAWYHVLACTKLKPPERDDFIKYAQKRELHASEATLSQNYEWVVAAMKTVGAELTPLMLSLTVDRLRQQNPGGEK